MIYQKSLRGDIKNVSCNGTTRSQSPSMVPKNLLNKQVSSDSLLEQKSNTPIRSNHATSPPLGSASMGHTE